MKYDLGVAWVSKADASFVDLLDSACRSRSLFLLQITPVNLEEVLKNLRSEAVLFRAFLDRSSDEDENFLPLVQWARSHGVLRINSYERALRARDKAGMHLRLFQTVHTPYTIILPSYKERPELGPRDLSPLGSTFTTKPSNGGGGEGVIVLCTSLDDIQTARVRFPEDKFLLQARVISKRLGDREAWFRVIYNTGTIYPFWWDTETHVYRSVTVAERYHFHLAPLEEITFKIARICGLHLFSTEIALSKEGIFEVVDYVNDPIDLTPQSQIAQCVPDEVLRYIAEDLIGWLEEKLKKEAFKKKPITRVLKASGSKTSGRAQGSHRSGSRSRARTSDKQ